MGERLKDKVFVANEEAEGDGDGALGRRSCVSLLRQSSGCDMGRASDGLQQGVW